MKKIAGLFTVAVLAGATTLGGYKLWVEETPETAKELQSTAVTTTPNFIPTSNPMTSRAMSAEAVDFTEAAEKTVNAVVHVKHYSKNRAPRNYMEFLRQGRYAEKEMITGAGSGVIITEDGYIVTNNHVIEGASKLEVTLNNNKNYIASVIGRDPKSDIAVLKIDTNDKLTYIPFGNSNSTKIGEWALAVGNPFNLTSTVTAGIISAKGRDLDETDDKFQSFIQTDAAINPGNSGGALVDVNGQLIGINTAITSQTGSYVGYAFAVPSNNVRKIVNDIIEYGDVQKTLMGISSVPLALLKAKGADLPNTQGVIVAGVQSGSGADKAGIQENDVIVSIDNVKIRKFTDLTAYVGSKSPNDVVNVTVVRDGNRKELPVKLIKEESYKIYDIGVQVINATKEELAESGVSHGVKINETLTERMSQYDLIGIIITEIDEKKVRNVEDVKQILSNKDSDEGISITLIDRRGNPRVFMFD